MKRVFLVVLVVLTMAVVAPVGAATLYMETTVSKVEDNGYVEFTDKSGNFFFFTEVSDKFKVGDKVELEVIAVFDGRNFVVEDMKYIMPEITVKFPNTMEELVAMYAGMAAICLAVFFGGFFAGHLHGKPKSNRRVYVHS